VAPVRVPFPLLVSLTLLVPGCAGDPYAREPDQSAADEWTLEPNSFYLPSFEPRGKAHVRAHVSVLEGGPVDAFLASGQACFDYPTDLFRPAAMLASVTNGTMEADLPAGRACLVLDNHDFAPGTSPGNGTARVSYRIEVWETR
jgi:hypothetical protein